MPREGERDGESGGRTARVLLIDDDASFLPEQVRQAFPAPKHEVECVGTGVHGVQYVRDHSPDVVLLDLRLPDQSGLGVYQEIRRLDARIPVIFITAARTADTAIEAMRQGAFNYLRKPLDLIRLREVVHEALEAAHRMSLPVTLTNAHHEGTEGAFLGSSLVMLEVCKAIGRVAAQDLPVLITGESGTGKELAARALWQHSARARAPFLALNCAAIPENLLESELFGHEKGAFTGADRRQVGKFEQCNGGTILLDEIGDMPLPLQAKMLRLLQEQTFQRLGGSETVRTDVRLIASTHHDLEALVQDRRFRADLFYRLAVFTIELPPLRERGDDIDQLTYHFIARYNREFGKSVREVAPEALASLRAYSWPGNIRELQSVVKRALLLSNGPTLLPAALPELDAPLRRSSPPQARYDLDELIAEQLKRGASDVYAQVIGDVERLLLARVIERTSGNLSLAATTLGISRQTLRVKLRALGLQVARSVESINVDDEVPLTSG